MNPSSEPWQEAENEIVAYIMGEMTPENAAEFERRLQSEESLRLQMEQWQSTLNALQEWADSEAPGVERLEDLPIPTVTPSGSREIPVLRLPELRKPLTVWRWLGVAAVFVLGFLAGWLAQPGKLDMERGSKPSSRGVAEPKTTIENREIPQVKEGAPTTSSPAHLANLQPGQEDRAADVRPARYTTEENGRLTIETTLKHSGAQALWVVDGNFNLTPTKGESS